jgi:hypothetical protein
VGDLRKPKPQRRRGLHSTGRPAALAFVAGALNAVVLARGLTVGGREDAMTALANFWQRVAGLQSGAVLRPSWYGLITHNYRLEHSPAYFFFDLLSRVFSPYQFTPLNYNSPQIDPSGSSRFRGSPVRRDRAPSRRSSAAPATTKPPISKTVFTRLRCLTSHERAPALRPETAHCRSLISHSRPAVSVSCASGLGGLCS